MNSVSIIGGGFCGTMVLYHLMLRDDLPALDIAWFDESARYGRGVAYATPYPEHLLNVPAGGMSALADDPAHFVNWLGAKGDVDPKAFYPRMVYGDYLTDLMKDALRMAAEKGHKVTQHATKYEAGDDKGAVIIHATGTTRPLWPGGATRHHPRLIANPYQPSYMSAVTPDTKIILILGTGLSAVDAILTLHKSGYGGTIICVSRHGLWPVAHGPKDKIWHWRRYVDAVRPHSNKIWQAMPEFLRKICLKKITYWNSVRHRMPPECAAILKTLKDSGRLQTHKGTIAAIETGDDHIALNMGGYKLSGDLAINCLGYISYLQKPAQDFRISNTEWILGAPLFGHLIETTAVPELREQARDVARAIGDRLIN